MANEDVKFEARGNGVPLWQIAEKLGISEPTITRRLRKELTAEEKTKIRAIIAEIKGAK